MINDRLSHNNWSAIDGILYFEDDIPYLIFSHSFETSPNGDMCLLTLSDDLTTATSQPITLFAAAEAQWAKPIPFTKAEFGLDGDVYFTDGPSLFKVEDKELFMLWSSWGTAGYAVGLAKSDTGIVAEPWQQVPAPLFDQNGGHAMIFKDLEQTLRFAYHFPNDHYAEKPQFADLIKENGNYYLSNRTDFLED
nr:family 43 glycosylhydrolase [Streptococcus thoraltensis]